MATEAQKLLLLLSWMSPAFPIGGFAYSHGLEQAIANGAVKNAGDLQDWINDLLQQGSAWNDAVLFAQCWRDVDALNDLAIALCGSAERWQETTQLGRNFSAAAGVWFGEAAAQAEIAYPIAAGQACATAGIERNDALMAFLQSFVAQQVSVAVRLVPLGQTEGLRVLRGLSPLIEATARRAAEATSEDLGSACIAAEIAAMKHETLPTRVFRT